MMQLKFSALNQFASLPVRKNEGDAGMDVTAWFVVMHSKPLTYGGYFLDMRKEVKNGE